MNKTFIIMKHEFRQTFKSRSFIIITLALPLLAILGLGIYQGVQHWYHPPAPQEEKIGYVDQTGLFNGYTSQPGVQFILYPGEQQAKDALLAKGIKEYFVIPADYLSSGLITRLPHPGSQLLLPKPPNKLLTFWSQTCSRER